MSRISLGAGGSRRTCPRAGLPGAGEAPAVCGDNPTMDTDRRAYHKNIKKRVKKRSERFTTKL